MIESKYLKDNMENIKRLMDIPALKHFEIKSLGKLLRLSKIREYNDGEEIIKEGDRDPWLYFLLSGEVRIVKSGEDIGMIDKKGEVFGEMRIIDSLSRSASVVADGRTVCLAVNTVAQDKLSQDEEKLDFLLLLYRIFAEYMSLRLRITNEQLMIAKKELNRYRQNNPKVLKRIINK
jgi:CRP/FNR family transcriptional regulator, cyclic AMP receptor protein